MNNETNSEIMCRVCRVCGGHLTTSTECANGICVKCYIKHQDALGQATACNANPNDSDAAAVPSEASGACQHNATVIPRETLDAMLKVKRQVKRKNMTRDEWIARAEKAEIALKRSEIDVMILRNDIVARNRRFEFVVPACVVIGVLVGISFGYLFFAP